MDQIKQKRLSRFRRGCEFAYRNTLGRSLPHGMISPRYLLPGQSSKVRIHRLLWLHGLAQVPFPFYIWMEIFLWLRWTLFSCWRWTFHSVRRLGPKIKDRENIGILIQFKRVLCLAFFHCVPPSEVYAFGLYRTGQGLTVRDYVFTNEVSAFHRWRDSQHGKTGESLRLLGDKYLSAEILMKNDVPVVLDLQLIPRGAGFDLSDPLKEYPRLFCKPRNGSAGRGCFVVARKETNAAPSVYKTKAGAVTKQSTWSCLLQAAALDDYLVQPFMTNHPFLAGLCETEDAITVRIITEIQDSKTMNVYSAVLEVPAPPGRGTGIAKKAQAENRFHVIIPIDPVSGEVRRLPEETLLPSAMEYYVPVYLKMGRIPMPFWNEIKKSAFASHSLFLDLYAIAWDYVVTSDGPFLLEGNTGWETRMPQIIKGGLLRDESD